VEIPGVVSAPIRLMRIPVGGGEPQLVLEMLKGWNHVCARAPASLCVALEESQDAKHLMVTAVDPLKGRGKVLRTFEKDPLANVGNEASALSPDGSTFAISRSGQAEIHIRLLSLSSGSDRDITVKGWPNLSWMGLNWSSDGKGLYCGSSSNQARTLLYVDLKGNARVLWQEKGGAGYPIWGIPSPDGRYLAIQGSVINSNVWMLEGF
jgi:Tol biopolymer transport system component